MQDPRDRARTGAAAYQQSDSVLVQPVGDETVLLDLDSGTYFTLDGVGTAIWREIEAGQGFDAIVEAVVERYDVDREQAVSDTSELLTELLVRGLINEG